MAVVARKRSGSSVFAAWCYATDVVGDVVHIMGNKVGSYFQVTKVNIEDESTMPAIGVIVQKLSPSVCVVQHRDLVSGVYTGLTPGSTLWVGSDSRLSSTPPPSPTSGYRIRQPMARVVAADEFLMWVQEPIKRLPN
jgi:hypothetical protein